MNPERIYRFEQLLRQAQEEDDGASGTASARDELTQLCAGGIPDEPSFLRPASYHTLLNLPGVALVDQYSAFVEEIGKRVAAEPAPTAEARPSKTDKLLREIERDVNRTFGGLAWFSGTADATEDAQWDPLWARIVLLDQMDSDKARSLAESTSDSPSASPSSPSSPPLSPLTPRTRRQSLLRPLFIYATLNPGLGYVQGLNSVAAVFLWVYSSADVDQIVAEAQTFFSLGAVLSQLRDLYVASLDSASSSSAVRLSYTDGPTPTGLGATLARFTSLLTWLDPTVAASLESKEIDPALYCFRWLTTLFANEFQLPDLVRVWDRIFSLFPSETATEPAEALSPILGHLIDISLAVVLLERPLIVSPFSTFPKIVARLQDPQIDGEQVEKLLGIAWEIRDRRLGRTKRSSVSDSPQNWRNAANKWAAAASAAASTASNSPAASSLRSRFWSTSSTPNAASEFDLDDSASVADSETSFSGGPPFASKGQRVGNIAEEVTTIDGKVLPPPPARIDDQVTLAQLIEDEMPKEEEEEEGPTLKERAATSWGGWKTSLSRLAASDAAAALSKTTTNLTIAAQMRAADLRQSTARLQDGDAAAALSKRTTNLSIQAQLLREQLAEQAPERIAKLKESVSGAGGRLLASGGAERGPRYENGGPSEQPFTPPRFSEGRSTSPGPEGAPGMEKSWSGGGPRPLLLSGAARRASNASAPDSPPTSRRMLGRSPSISPTFVRPIALPSLNDLPVPVGSLARANSRGSHGRSASSFTPPTIAAPSSSSHSRSASTVQAMSQSDDLPIHSLRLQSPVAESPTARLRRPIARHAGSSDSATPAANGRGWTLSDAPVRVPEPVQEAFDPSTISESRPAFASATPPPPSDSPNSARDDRGDDFHSAASTIPHTPLEQPANTNGVDDSVRNLFKSTSQDPVSDSVRNMFSRPDVSPERPHPPRRSSLADTNEVAPLPRRTSLNTRDLSSSTSSLPSATTPIDEDTPLSPVGEGHVAPTRSKIMRRPGAVKKRHSSSRGSIGGSIDLSAADRRSVSDFLIGGRREGATGSDEGDSTSRRSSIRNKRMSVAGQSGSASPAVETSGRQSMDWDEEARMIAAYADSDQ